MPKRISIYTEVTSYCNSQCKFCPINLVNRKGFIKEEVRDRVVDFVKSNPNVMFTIYFHLIGEPLLYNDLEEYIKLLSLPNCVLWVCTNGLLLNDKRLMELQRAGLKNLWFSLFYANRKDYKKYVGRDNFLEVEKNLYNLLSKKNMFNKIKIITFSKESKKLEGIIKDRVDVKLNKARKQYSWSLMGKFPFNSKPLYTILNKFRNKTICISINGEVCFYWRDYNFKYSIGNICELKDKTILAEYRK